MNDCLDDFNETDFWNQEPTPEELEKIEKETNLLDSWDDLKSTIQNNK